MVFSLSVKVRFYDILKDKVSARHNLDQGCLIIDLKDGATIADLLLLSGLTTDEVGLIMINDRQATANTALSNGDQVQLFSPLSGG